MRLQYANMPWSTVHCVTTNNATEQTGIPNIAMVTTTESSSDHLRVPSMLKSRDQHSQPPPPLDGSWGWIALLAAFIAHVLTTGYMLSLSVFLVEWQIFYDSNAQMVGFVGVILGFMGPVMGLPAGGLSKTFGCRTVVMISGFSISLGMLLSKFATSLYHLYLTTMLIAVGIGFTYQPAVTVIGHYFQKMLGFANGVAMSGVGVGMLVMPPFLQFLIDVFTWQNTYFILAAIYLTVVICGLLFRPSERELYFLNQKTTQKQLVTTDRQGNGVLPAGNQRRNWYYYPWKCIKFFGLHLIWQNPSLNFIFVGFGLLGFGFYSSLVFFASKAVFDLNIKQATASWLISLVGIGSFTSSLSHGVLIDLKIISPIMLFVVSAMMCCISDILNPFTTSFAGLAVCAFFLGAGSRMAIAVTIVCIRKAVHPANVSNAWGISMTLFGTGNLVGVFLMAFLKDATGSYNISFFVAATALFLGASSMLMLHILQKVQERRKDATKDQPVQERASEEGKNSKEHLPLNEELAVKGELKRTAQETADESV